MIYRQKSVYLYIYICIFLGSIVYKIQKTYIKVIQLVLSTNVLHSCWYFTSHYNFYSDTKTVLSTISTRKEYRFWWSGVNCQFMYQSICHVIRIPRCTSSHKLILSYQLQTGDYSIVSQSIALHSYCATEYRDR